MGRMCGRRAGGEPAVRKGPWTLEEDLVLVGYVSHHGEGSWDNLARSAGLNRNGKSCRLRWLNYLRPGVRRGSITPAEDAVIRELHATLGNRWSKIATHLPGRTDNEIKNYWRTRVQIRRPAAAAAKYTQQQQPYRAPAAAAPTTTAMAASEGAASSSSSPASANHGSSSSAAGDYYYWCMKPPYNDPDQQGAYHSQKTVASAAAQDSSSTSTTTAGDGGCKLTGYSHPYYSEMGSSVADGVKMVDADNFWNVVDNFWGTLPVPDATF